MMEQFHLEPIEYRAVNSEHVQEPTIENFERIFLSSHI